MRARLALANRFAAACWLAMLKRLQGPTGDRLDVAEWSVSSVGKVGVDGPAHVLVHHVESTRRSRLGSGGTPEGDRLTMATRAYSKGQPGNGLMLVAPQSSRRTFALMDAELP